MMADDCSLNEAACFLTRPGSRSGHLTRPVRRIGKIIPLERQPLMRTESCMLMALAQQSGSTGADLPARCVCTHVEPAPVVPPPVEGTSSTGSRRGDGCLTVCPI